MKGTQMGVGIALVLAAVVTMVPGASAHRAKSTISSSLARINEPGSTSDFDRYSFQEPTGVNGPWRKPADRPLRLH